jgi:predicted GNAT family acetyltransferase
VERNVAATVLAGLRRGSGASAGARVAWLEDSSGGIRAVMMRTPPHPLLSTELDPGEAPALLSVWLRGDPEPPGVSATTDTARALASAWEAQTGRAARVHMEEAMHVLSEVSGPPRPAAGELRPARAGEHELLRAWELAFVAEAGVPGAQDAGRRVEQRLAAEAQFVWDDDGPVSTVGVSPPIAGAVRIGPVYTPPERRGRGYASSAVAAVSRHALERGASRCTLFTDLANPTSNRIYASVGFRRVADWEWLSFPPAQAASPRA